jgi:exodeoxyribonuclease-5
MNAISITLTPGQQKAADEIMSALGSVNAWSGGREHSLQGYAGTGKTTMLMVLVRQMQAEGKNVAVCAPTNKAVAVLERKMREGGIEVDSATIYSLLGLTPGSDDAKRKPKRVGRNRSGAYDVIIIDECSMVGIDLMDWIRRDLANKFVLYIGDPAQLPPVGETLSQTFQTENVSTLDRVMRQAEGNPIIAMSIEIRRMIREATPDWSVLAPTPGDVSDIGIFRPGPDVTMAWVEDAFLSDEFAEDNDRFRYLCWTNDRVAFINRHIRHMVYGDTATPYVPGERVLVRSRVSDESGHMTLIQTNDEATVETIVPGTFVAAFDAHVGGTYKDGRTYDELPAWEQEFETWDMQLRTRGDNLVDIRIPRDPAAYKAICDRAVSEAKRNKARWFGYFGFTDQITKVQSVYAMTIHCSQGSTFENVFVDVSDCARNPRTVEMLQLLYVGCTRPSKALVLV